MAETLKELWEDALPRLQMSVPFNLRKHTKVVFRVGSHAHGTYIPPEDAFGVDDVDLMIVVIPPPEFVLGMKTFDHGQYKHGKLDVVFYEWGKFLRLIEKSNPNVVGTLWNDPEDVLFPDGPLAHSATLDLFADRDAFLSKKMYPAFVGYARGQLHKMTHMAHQGYMGEKRKTLVDKFGYDVKNAAHMIRLLRMACETLETGTITVRRPDAEEIIEIKRGAWTLDQVIAEGERLFGRAHEALESCKLPEHPNTLLLQKRMISGYMEDWT